MPQIKQLDVLEGKRLKIERTSGGAVRGVLTEVYHDAGGHPVVITVEKNNGDRFAIPWHAVRSFVIED